MLDTDICASHAGGEEVSGAARPRRRPQHDAAAQVKRDSFAHYSSPDKEQNEVAWTPTPLEALLDVDRLIAAWRQRGLTIHRARRPDPTRP